MIDKGCGPYCSVIVASSNGILLPEGLSDGLGSTKGMGILSLPGMIISIL